MQKIFFKCLVYEIHIVVTRHTCFSFFCACTNNEQNSINLRIQKFNKLDKLKFCLIGQVNSTLLNSRLNQNPLRVVQSTPDFLSSFISLLVRSACPVLPFRHRLGIAGCCIALRGWMSIQFSSHPFWLPGRFRATSLFSCHFGVICS